MIDDLLSGQELYGYVTRITEQLQSDLDLMFNSKRAGIQPGREVLLGPWKASLGRTARTRRRPADLPAEVASHVLWPGIPRRPVR